MQFVFNFRNCLTLALVLAGGYYCYHNVFADVASRDVSKLVRAHRAAEPTRRLIIERRILSIYESSKDYDTLVRSLDSPSPITQGLAASVLAEKVERQAVPTLLQMLAEPDRTDNVKEALARGAGLLGLRQAIPRLVELTDKAEAPDVRSAAHHALQALTGAGAQIKLSDATRDHWTLWLRSQSAPVTR